MTPGQRAVVLYASGHVAFYLYLLGVAILHRLGIL